MSKAVRLISFWWRIVLVARIIGLFVVNVQAQPHDFQAYGYNYTIDASEAWYFYPPNIDRETDDSVIYGNIATAEACAQRCSTTAAPAGAWNSNQQECVCRFNLEFACLEPCVVETGVEFSTTPYRATNFCEFSFCEYNKETPYCQEEKQFDLEACQVKKDSMKAAEPDLSAFGYSYILNAVDGWYLQPPSSTVTNRFYNGILSAASCAAVCSNDGAPAGGWNSAYNQCYCYYALESNCLEPCIAETGIEFSSVPYQASNYCPKSYCDVDYFYPNEQVYCDDIVKFNRQACDERIEELNNNQSNGTMVDLTDVGFPHTQDLALGFYFQPPPSSDDSFLVFDGFLQGTSCAKQCAAEQAPAGAWNTRTNTCWCYFAMETQCLDYCITTEQGFNFNTRPFAESSYCPKSFCDPTYFYDNFTDYCTDGVEYNQEECEAKLFLLPTAQPTPMPIISRGSPSRGMMVTTTTTLFSTVGVLLLVLQELVV